ncbi:MAG: carbohydrate-binding protein, partial [Desulfobulbaceae bacterium]|nr:carbohydrate-binding protein [Desulfobulbaceae bacterium]
MKSSIISSTMLVAGIAIAIMTGVAHSAEWHVSVKGADTNAGALNSPFLTIQRAADVAQPGDTITVHEGVYREEVAPPRGGTSDDMRITYQAAEGEEVIVTGSEIVKGWVHVQNDTWKVVIADSYFEGFNPFKDVIYGDWFISLGRDHHTGAVYLNNHWLTESVNLDDVLQSAGNSPLWYTSHSSMTGYLMNVAWLGPGQPSDGITRIEAETFAEQQGIQTAACSEGGQCIGWIENGDWVRYDNVDFGENTEQIEIRAASIYAGAEIELRLDGPQGQLLGTCTVNSTGGWQVWESFTAAITPTSGTNTLCLLFRPPTSNETKIWAQFPGVNPNDTDVEVNVRKTVFSPKTTGVDYITLRGFRLRNAATPWAPPTAAQWGLVSAHWCKGWVIESNDIAYSKCSGVALGKYGDEWDNLAGSAEGYVGTLTRALTNGWNKATVGSHIVRNNHIHNCEQAGIVGSLGCSFSTVEGNIIHDIYRQKLFSGAEMSG